MRADSDADLFVVRPDGTVAEHADWAEQLQALAHDGSRWTGNDLRVLELSEADVKLGVVANDQILVDIREQGIRLTSWTDRAIDARADQDRVVGQCSRDG